MNINNNLAETNSFCNFFVVLYSVRDKNRIRGKVLRGSHLVKGGKTRRRKKQGGADHSEVEDSIL